MPATRHAPRATRHAPRATRHAPRATRHAPRATRHAPRATLLSSQERLKTIFNELISEFRKTVTLLTGFRVDMVGETRQYEVRPSMALKGDVLKFRCSKEGDMELLPTEFAARLSPQIETYLQARPAHTWCWCCAGASARAALTSALTSASHLPACAQERHSIPAFLASVTLRLLDS